MKPWNQAAWKQHTYRKRVEVKAVGAFPEGHTRFSSDPHCEGCGYHVCSCTPNGSAHVATSYGSARFVEVETSTPNCCHGGGCSDVCQHEPESLGIHQAYAQCFENQTVRVIEDPVESGDLWGLQMRYAGGGGFEASTDNGLTWSDSPLSYLPLTRTAEMRFEVVRNEVEQDESPSLTLAQVAKLPVWTKVVVDCGGGGITSGMVFIVRADWTSHYIPSVGLCDAIGTPWTVTLDCAHLTFKVVR